MRNTKAGHSAAITAKKQGNGGFFTQPADFPPFAPILRIYCKQLFPRGVKSAQKRSDVVWIMSDIIFPTSDIVFPISHAVFSAWGLRHSLGRIAYAPTAVQFVNHSSFTHLRCTTMNAKRDFRSVTRIGNPPYTKESLLFIIRKTKCIAFPKRSVRFPKTKRILGTPPRKHYHQVLVYVQCGKYGVRTLFGHRTCLFLDFPHIAGVTVASNPRPTRNHGRNG